jgi:hypothetical protein
VPPLPAINTFVSVEDYLAGKLHSEIRHEYVDGQVYAMGGASDSHGLIVNALAFALTPAARHKNCLLFTSNMKLRLNIDLGPAGEPEWIPDSVLLRVEKLGGLLAVPVAGGQGFDQIAHNVLSARSGSIFNKASRPASARSRQPFPR